MSAAVRLLIIDDDRALCELLSDYLSSAGFAVEFAHTGDEGVQRALGGEYAIAVLDVMLPGIDGFEALRRIRTRSRVPILMLTARGEDVDRIVGLEIGADDYLPKPFNPRELAARLHAILRRARGESSRDAVAGHEDVLTVDDVELDPAARTVLRGGQPVELTGTEFALLDALLRGAGKVVTREDLSLQVLGRRLQPFDRSIDMHISHIRKKLGAGAAGTDRIRNIRGEGYIYVTLRGPRAESQARTESRVDQ